MTITIEHKTKLNLFECSACAAHIALTLDFERVLRGNHREFYCPNGHSQYFPSQSEAERLRQALHAAELEKTRLTQQVKDAVEARDRLAIQQAISERETARLKKRAAAGVCPCCNRTFVQLQRHMKTQHSGHDA